MLNKSCMLLYQVFKIMEKNPSLFKTARIIKLNYDNKSVILSLSKIEFIIKNFEITNLKLILYCTFINF
jgi:hypothetical protein